MLFRSVEKARAHEESGQFSEALTQWESLREIHPQHPGLDIEVQRLRRRREDQVRAEAKSTWITQIDQANSAHQHTKALSLISEALLEFPGDPELVALEKFANTFLDRQKDAQQKLAQGKELENSGKTEEALDVLRGAAKIDPRNPAVRSALIDLLLKQAQTLFDKDWRLADPFVKEALELESTNLLAKSLRTHIQDRSQTEAVVQCLSKARELQAEGKLRDAVSELDKGLDKYPKESRLIQLRTVLEQNMSTAERLDLRNRDLQDVKRLAEESQHSSDVSQLASVFERTRVYGKYQNDPDFRDPMSAIEQRYEKKKPRPTPEIVESVALTVARPEAPFPPRTVVRVGPLSKYWKPLGIGLAAALAIFLPFFLFFRPPDKGKRAEPIKPVTVTINGKFDEPQVVDLNNNSDVSSVLPSPGLMPGKYKITAKRPGYQNFEETVEIKATDSAKTITIPWKSLPTQLVIRHALPNSDFKIVDKKREREETITSDAQGDVKKDLSPGEYAISWKPSNSWATFEVVLVVKEAKDGRADLIWNAEPNFTSLVTLFDAKTSSFEGFAGSAKIFVAGTPQMNGGELPWVERDKPLAISNYLNRPLVELPPLDAAHSSAICFDLWATVTVPARKPVPPPPPPTVIANPPSPAPVVTPPPPKKRPIVDIGNPDDFLEPVKGGKK